MTVSAGASYRRCTQIADDGTLNRKEPSPTRDTTVRDGCASLAPTAAPPDQPSAPPPWCSTEPGRTGRRCSATALLLVTTSVSTIASSPSSRRRTHARGQVPGGEPVPRRPPGRLSPVELALVPCGRGLATRRHQRAIDQVMV